MVVDEINVSDIAAVEPKYDAPITGDSDGPKSSKIALQGMQSESGKVHAPGLRGLIEPCQDAFDLLSMLRQHPPPISLLVDGAEILVAKADYHGSV
jgi:hypothetical protein